MKKELEEKESFEKLLVTKQFNDFISSLGDTDFSDSQKKNMFLVFFSGYCSSYFIFTNILAEMEREEANRALDVITDDISRLAERLGFTRKTEN